MAGSGTYYMNGATLLTSSTIFLNKEMTIVAPNGYYSDGTYVRQQISGILQPPVPCPSCLPPCNAIINVHGNEGEYVINMDLGGTADDVGAILIYFNPIWIPDGILAHYNNVYYNALSSPSAGFLCGEMFFKPTFVGRATEGTNCNMANKWFTLQIYNWNGTGFIPSGTEDTIYISEHQLEFTPGEPGNCLMVIPKPAPTPSELNITIYGPCGGTKFDLEVQCPAALHSFAGTVRKTLLVDACAADLTQTYFNGPVNGTPGHVGMYDFVFSDKNGQYRLPAGYYRITNSTHNVMQVDSHGIVIGLVNC